MILDVLILGTSWNDLPNVSVAYQWLPVMYLLHLALKNLFMSLILQMNLTRVSRFRPHGLLL